jgi:hypothetical protein
MALLGRQKKRGKLVLNFFFAFLMFVSFYCIFFRVQLCYGSVEICFSIWRGYFGEIDVNWRGSFNEIRICKLVYSSFDDSSV